MAESIVPAAIVLHPLDVQTFGRATPDQRSRLATAAVMALAIQHMRGAVETGSQRVAAYHEAGHAIVATALGYVVESVCVGQDPALKLWGGYTDHRFPGEERGVCQPTDPAAERIATVELAGFIAEANAGPMSRLSSVDERFRVAILCAAIDDTTGSLAGTALRRVINRTVAVLNRNEAALEVMADLLMIDARPKLRLTNAVLATVRPSTDLLPKVAS